MSTSIKVQYEECIHWMKSFPSNHDELISNVKTLFSHYPEFPQQFYFTYTDDDGDEIYVTSDHDLDVIRGWEEGWTIKLWVYPFDYTVQKQSNNSQKPTKLEKLLKKKSLKESKILKIHQKIEQQQKNPLQLEFLTVKLKKFNNKLQQINDKIIKQEQCSLEKQQIQDQEMLNSSLSLHSYVKCDNCLQFPIVGIRYKCSECEDYDLCEKCEQSVEHSHDFIKIRNAQQAPDYEIIKCKHQH